MWCSPGPDWHCQQQGQETRMTDWWRTSVSITKSHVLQLFGSTSSVVDVMDAGSAAVQLMTRLYIYVTYSQVWTWTQRFGFGWGDSVRVCVCVCGCTWSRSLCSYCCSVPPRSAGLSSSWLLMPDSQSSSAQGHTHTHTHTQIGSHKDGNTSPLPLDVWCAF